MTDDIYDRSIERWKVSMKRCISGMGIEYTGEMGSGGNERKVFWGYRRLYGYGYGTGCSLPFECWDA